MKYKYSHDDDDDDDNGDDQHAIIISFLYKNRISNEIATFLWRTDTSEYEYFAKQFNFWF